MFNYRVGTPLWLPEPKGRDAGEPAECPECWPNVRNFGALFLLVAEYERRRLRLILSPAGEVLAREVREEETFVSSGVPSRKAMWSFRLLEACAMLYGKQREGERVYWQEPAMIPVAVDDVIRREMAKAFGEDKPQYASLLALTEDALRPPKTA